MGAAAAAGVACGDDGGGAGLVDAGPAGGDAGADAGTGLPALWPVQDAGYVSAVPGLTGYGMDSVGGSGRDGAPGRVTVFLLSDLSTATVDRAVDGYQRIREGSLKGFAALPGPKVLLPVRSGYVEERDDFRPGSYCDVYGQFAPGDGLIFRNTLCSSVVTFGATTARHQRWWHVDARPGDDAGGIPTGNRDGLSAGSAREDDDGGGSHNLYLNCAFLWTLDEIVDAYYGLDLATFAYCVFAEPLHKSIHDDGVVESHGFGPIFGGGRRWDRLSLQRNLFAHAIARQPLVAALRLAIANNLVYDPADTSGNVARVLDLVNDYDAAQPNTQPMFTNWVGNLVVRGPSSHADAIDVVAMSVRQPDGSRGHVGGNGVDGWSFSSQDALRTGTFPPGWAQPALVPEAWPAGWGDQGQGVARIGAATTPDGFSAAERRAFAARIAASVGPRPGQVTPANRAAVIAGQVLAWLDGGPGAGEAVNSVDGGADPAGWPDPGQRFAPSAGGWPVLARVDENPFAPTSWHAPLPLQGNAPDDRVLTSGTFDNGLSKVGLTAIEAWALTERYRRGGQ